MKKKLHYLLAGLLPLALPVGASAGAFALNFPNVTQEHSEWCWDASTSAILQYRGFNVPQCTIANWAFNVNYACSQPYLFDWPDATANQANSLEKPNGVAGALMWFGGRYSTFQPKPLTYQEIAYAISSYDPVVIGWGWDGGGGHAIVAYGYDDNGAMLYYMNPWPNEGMEIGQYAWMLRGAKPGSGTHTWTASLITH
jgi:hypothetical protein